MKAVVARELGAPDTFAIEDIPVPPLGPDGVRIAVHSAGVSYVAALIAAGRYQVKPPLPFVPGMEFGGVVEEVGPEVVEVKPGDRVMAGGLGGGFAEQAVVPAAMVARIKSDMTFDQAAVFRVAYGTAYHGLAQRAQIQPGETLLVLGAAGATGEAAVQVGKALGARVIASASTEAKRQAALAIGADLAIDSGAEDWRAQVKEMTGGRGPDVVFDPVGGPGTERAFRSLAWRGRHLVVGFVGGPIPALPINLALLKGAALVGVDYRQFRELERPLEASNLGALARIWEDGQLRPTIGRVFAFGEFAAALQAASENGPPGRVVLKIRP